MSAALQGKPATAGTYKPKAILVPVRRSAEFMLLTHVFMLLRVFTLGSGHMNAQFHEAQSKVLATVIFGWGGMI